jgi:hypothetical protein
MTQVGHVIEEINMIEKLPRKPIQSPSVPCLRKMVKWQTEALEDENEEPSFKLSKRKLGGTATLMKKSKTVGDFTIFSAVIDEHERFEDLVSSMSQCEFRFKASVTVTSVSSEDKTVFDGYVIGKEIESM